MAKRSLKASDLGISKAKRAFERTGWTQEYLAAEVGLSTRQSVWKFFKGKPIERYIFVDLCFQLNLEWEDIADLPKLEDIPLETPNVAANSLDLEQLIKLWRSRIKGQIRAQCGTVRSFVEFAQPLPLENIYTDSNLLTRLSNQRWLEVSDLQKIGDKYRGFANPERETVPAFDAVNTHQKLMLLGKPGAGKTTFLQHLALQCIEGNFKTDCVPIFIFLRTFVAQAKENQDFSLLGYLQRLGNNYNLDSEKITTLLQQGKVFILLDGLDEVPPEFEQEVLQQIQQFAQIYYQNSLIITCRIAGQQYRFQGFTYVELADFNPSQVESFARKWFVATDKDSETGLAKAEKFLEQLQHKNNQSLEHHLHTSSS